MNYYQRLTVLSSGAESCAFANIKLEELAPQVHQLFVRNGYRVCGQEGATTIYEKGSYTLRILFGAFCKYYKFGTSLHLDSNGEVIVTLQNKSTGISGGLIGINQMKKEHARLIVELQKF